MVGIELRSMEQLRKLDFFPCSSEFVAKIHVHQLVFVMLLHSIRSRGRGCQRRHKTTNNRETMSTGALFSFVLRESGRDLSLTGNQHSLCSIVNQILYLHYFLPLSPISHEMI